MFTGMSALSVGDRRERDDHVKRRFPVCEAPHPIPRRVSTAIRLKPMVRRELERLANRSGERFSRYVSAILEAHCDGLVYCKTCERPHPILHSVENRRVGELL